MASTPASTSSPTGTACRSPRAASTRWRWAMPTSRRRAGMPAITKLLLAMRTHGVDFSAWPGGPVSAMHGPAEIEATAARLPRRAGRPARRGRGRLTMTQARALLLGERLDHRGLPREGAPLTDPVPLATPEGFTAFAFRWGAVVFIGATAAQEAAVIEMLKPRLTAPLAHADRGDGAHRDRRRAGRHRPRRRDPPARPVDAAARGGGGCAGEKSAALAHQEVLLAEALDRLEPMVTTLQDRGAAGRVVARAAPADRPRAGRAQPHHRARRGRGQAGTAVGPPGARTPACAPGGRVRAEGTLAPRSTASCR